MNKLTKKETWVPVPGYEGLYEASDLGRVRSLSRQGVDGRKLYGQIIGTKSDIGYTRCVLCKDGKYVPESAHRIVAKTFFNPSDENFTVHHINGIRSDNRIDNLEVTTFSEHARHHLCETPLDNRGSKNGQSVLTEEDVINIRAAYATGKFLQKEIAEQFSVSRCHISDIVNRKRWAHI